MERLACCRCSHLIVVLQYNRGKKGVLMLKQDQYDVKGCSCLCENSYDLCIQEHDVAHDLCTRRYWPMHLRYWYSVSISEPVASCCIWVSADRLIIHVRCTLKYECEEHVRTHSQVSTWGHNSICVCMQRRLAASQTFA